MSNTIIGLNPRSIDDTAQFTVGQTGSDGDAEYVYVQAAGLIPARGSACRISAANLAYALTTANDHPGNRIGIAPDTAPNGTYFWALVRGPVEVLAAAGYAAGNQLFATTHAGVLDDDAAGPAVQGLTVTGGNAGTRAALLQGWASFPVLAAAASESGGQVAQVTANQVGPVRGDPTLTVYAGRVDARLDRLDAFEAAERFTTNLVSNATVRVAGAAIAYPIPGNPMVPAQTPDARFTVSVGANSKELVLADLLALPAVSGSPRLDGSNPVNSLRAALGDETVYVARHTSGAFRVSADSTGDLTLSITLSEIDQEAWSRKSSTARIPAGRLPPPEPLADGSVTKAKLAQAVQDAIDGAAEVDGISLSGRDLEFVSADARKTKTVSLPRELPAPRTDDGGKYAALNSGGTAYELVDAPSGGGGTVTTEQIQDAAAALFTNANDGTLGDVTATYGDDDSPPTVSLALKPGVVTPADLNMDAAGRTAGRLVRIAAGGRFEGAALPFFRTLHDAAGQGLNVGTSGNDHRTNFPGTAGLFSPRIDLDDLRDGIVYAEASLALTGQSDAAVDFPDAANRRISGEVSVSKLKGLSAWNDSTFQSNPNSIAHQVGVARIMRGAARVGDVQLWLAKNAANELGYVLAYDGQTAGYNFNVTEPSLVVELLTSAIGAAAASELPDFGVADDGEYLGVSVVDGVAVNVWKPVPDITTDDSLEGVGKPGALVDGANPNALRVADGVRYSDAKVDARVRAGNLDLLQDTVGTATVTPAVRSDDRFITEVSSPGLSFTIGATTYRITDIQWENGASRNPPQSTLLSVDISPGNSRAALRGYAFRIGSRRYHFDAAGYVQGTSDDYSWRDAADIGTSPVEIAVYEPLGPENLIEGGATNGQVPEWDAAAERWKPKTISTGGLSRIFSDDSLTGGGASASDLLKVTRPVDPNTVVSHADSVLTRAEDGALSAGLVIATADDIRLKKAVAAAPGAAHGGVNRVTLQSLGAATAGLSGYRRPPAGTALGSIAETSWLTELLLGTTGPDAVVVKIDGIGGGAGDPSTIYVSDGTTTATLAFSSGRYASNTVLTRAAGTVYTFWSDAQGSTPVKVNPQYRLETPATGGALPPFGVADANRIFVINPSGTGIVTRPFRFQETLHDGAGVGVSPSNTNASLHGAFQKFTGSGGLDLDDVAQGELHCSISLNIDAGYESGNVGFNAAHEQTVRASSIIFASDLKVALAYSASRFNGVIIGQRIPVYVGSVKVGDILPMLAKNSANEVGYFIAYQSMLSSAPVKSLTISSNIEAGWSLTDGGATGSETSEFLLFTPRRISGTVRSDQRFIRAPGSGAQLPPRYASNPETFFELPAEGTAGGNEIQLRWDAGINTANSGPEHSEWYSASEWRGLEEGQDRFGTPNRRAFFKTLSYRVDQASSIGFEWRKAWDGARTGFYISGSGGQTGVRWANSRSNLDRFEVWGR